MIDNGQDEALIILAEECSEVIQAVTKIHRWGASSNNNGRNNLTNLEQLSLELADLQDMIDIVIDQFQMNPSIISNDVQLKKNKLTRYSTYLQHYGSNKS
jgi:NTP pyrophosphatase (non-canonical NTP hydrolase)